MPISPLYKALMASNLQQIQKILEERSEKATDKMGKGFTTIEVAALFVEKTDRTIKIIQILMENGCKVTSSAVTKAIEQFNNKLVKFLLKSNLDLDCNKLEEDLKFVLEKYSSSNPNKEAINDIAKSLISYGVMVSPDDLEDKLTELSCGKPETLTEFSKLINSSYLLQNTFDNKNIKIEIEHGFDNSVVLNYLEGLFLRNKNGEAENYKEIFASLKSQLDHLNSALYRDLYEEAREYELPKTIQRDLDFLKIKKTAFLSFSKALPALAALPKDIFKEIFADEKEFLSLGAYMPKDIEVAGEASTHDQ